MPVINRNQKRVSEPLNLELPVTWVRGTELGFLATAANALNNRAISPASKNILEIIHTVDGNFGLKCDENLEKSRPKKR